MKNVRRGRRRSRASATERAYAFSVLAALECWNFCDALFSIFWIFVFVIGGIENNKEHRNLIDNCLDKNPLIVVDLDIGHRATDEDIEVMRIGHDGRKGGLAVLFDDHFIADTRIPTGKSLPCLEALRDRSPTFAVHDSHKGPRSVHDAQNAAAEIAKGFFKIIFCFRIGVRRVENGFDFFNLDIDFSDILHGIKKFFLGALLLVDHFLNEFILPCGFLFIEPKDHQAQGKQNPQQNHLEYFFIDNKFFRYRYRPRNQDRSQDDHCREDDIEEKIYFLQE